MMSAFHSPTITVFTCAEALRRRGLLLDGGPIPSPRPLIERSPMIAEIQAAVAEHYAIPLAEMVSARRAKEVAQPRQVAMYLAKQLTPRSLPQIGRLFGGRDRTTVIWAVRQTEKRARQDSELREAVIAILLKLEPLTRSALWPHRAGNA